MAVPTRRKVPLDDCCFEQDSKEMPNSGDEERG